MALIPARSFDAVVEAQRRGDGARVDSLHIDAEHVQLLLEGHAVGLLEYGDADK